MSVIKQTRPSINKTAGRKKRQVTCVAYVEKKRGAVGSLMLFCSVSKLPTNLKFDCMRLHKEISLLLMRKEVSATWSNVTQTRNLLKDDLSPARVYLKT